DINGGA
nr:RecName: Full=Cutinase 2; AltName: Full=Cutin hydrolase 2 [Colletotrichum kahawae]